MDSITHNVNAHSRQHPQFLSRPVQVGRASRDSHVLVNTRQMVRLLRLFKRQEVTLGRTLWMECAIMELLSGLDWCRTPP